MRITTERTMAYFLTDASGCARAYHTCAVPAILARNQYQGKHNAAQQTLQ